MNEPWLTKAEVARELKVSTKTIERLGIKPDMQVGRQNRYLLSSVEAQLRNCGITPAGNVIRLVS